jgi:hypothetical protein
MARSDTRQDSVFVASVEIAAETIAHVHVGWQGEPDRTAEDSLRAWVLDVLTGSSLLERAELIDYPVVPGEPATVYDIRAAPRRPNPDQPPSVDPRAADRSEGPGGVLELFLVPRLRAVRPETSNVRAASSDS